MAESAAVGLLRRLVEHWEDERVSLAAVTVDNYDQVGTRLGLAARALRAEACDLLAEVDAAPPPAEVTDRDQVVLLRAKLAEVHARATRLNQALGRRAKAARTAQVINAVVTKELADARA